MPCDGIRRADGKERRLGAEAAVRIDDAPIDMPPNVERIGAMPALVSVLARMLAVRQNLEMHAKLFDLPPAERRPRAYAPGPPSSRKLRTASISEGKIRYR